LVNPNPKSITIVGLSAMVMESHSQGKDKTSWIPNSSASFHVTCEPLNIKQMQKFDGLDQIFIGNGK